MVGLFKFSRFSLLLLLVLASLGWACGNNQESSKPKRKPKIESLADLGALPKYVTDPPGNPTSPEKVKLGRLLFFDPILSGSKDVACATCHQPEFSYAEFLETSIGVGGMGRGSKRFFLDPNDIPFVKRNSQSILNVAFNGIRNGETYHPDSAAMFWDLRTKGLEEQALFPIRTFEEMRGHGYEEDKVVDDIVKRIKAIPEYRSLFAAAFGGQSDPVNAGNLAKAIASYERTLIANNSRFDQYMRGDSSALTTGEKEGLNLFLKAGCAKCHSGPMFSDFKLHTLGVPDTPNRPETDAGGDNNYGFRTPTLRNLRYTSPYMHSGAFKTLDQVMLFYEDLTGGKIENPKVEMYQMDSLVSQINVKFKDIDRIVEFLNSLNDESFDKSIPEKVPSGLPVSGM
ncbi:Cytochrome c551 peroxidase [Dyadobacter sp. CECT 9623]|uniref:Cytochrome c551 peroxidase n=1 Tax=Dyadobacter linearis TaxID=2823330 RepID=A0ABM8UVZ1_9BACT|nr:cytochrome c peroxidase [Dyadobacter sp. CECT 9623]CAG5073004.1 Cytochrome c551 peroxidase [Dyadobacter sp. CECT 9623]